MKKKEHEAFARQAAKSIKTEADRFRSCHLTVIFIGTFDFSLPVCARSDRFS
ncbi:MAG: hypothetical protein ACJAWQ_000968 [Paraglaciecola sp.]|jgi:hypothetical protein